MSNCDAFKDGLSFPDELLTLYQLLSTENVMDNKLFDALQSRKGCSSLICGDQVKSLCVHRYLAYLEGELYLKHTDTDLSHLTDLLSTMCERHHDFLDWTIHGIHAWRPAEYRIGAETNKSEFILERHEFSQEKSEKGLNLIWNPP